MRIWNSSIEINSFPQKTQGTSYQNTSVLPRVLFVLSYFQGKDQDKLKSRPKERQNPPSNCTHLNKK